MSLLDSVEHLRTGLDYHLERQNVLVSNLAQANTPGYRPKDLAREFEGAMDLAMTATQPGHVGAAAEGPSFHVTEDETAKAGADGNAVDIDREAVKISSNQTRYDILAQLASSELATLTWAANDGKSG